MSLLGTSSKNVVVLWSETDTNEDLGMISTDNVLK